MSDDGSRPGYIYDPSWDQELARLRSLEELNDPVTREHIEELGIEPGWRCLEVGGGAGSIARWMAEVVGPDGMVVVTDIDVRFLEDLQTDNLKVIRHDIVNDDLEEEPFDLVHSRFLLEHLPAAEVALRKMVRALRPGGWLLAEDVDMMFAINANQEERFAMTPKGAKLGAELSGIAARMMKGRGIDAEYGRSLPRYLRAAGLEEIGAQGRFDLVWSDSKEALTGRLSVEHLTKVAVDLGAMTSQKRDEVLTGMSDPDEAYYTPARISAWGRKTG